LVLLVASEVLQEFGFQFGFHEILYSLSCLGNVVVLS
jgi:hypothetical protein